MYFTKTQQITTTKATPSPLPANITEHIFIVNGTNATQPEPIQWTPVNISESNVTIVTDNITEVTTEDTNVTDTQNTTFASRKRNLTRPDFVKEDLLLEGISESRTEKPLSLETTFLQTRIPPNVESSRRVIDPRQGGMDTGAIAGISFAALVVAALAGSTIFILYRRRYLNKPQTLNDKCSNPDSSGYLDDSTIRVSFLLISFYLYTTSFLNNTINLRAH